MSDPTDPLAHVWIAVGAPGFSGLDKRRRHAAFDARFGPDGWRWAWYVRGRTVPFDVAIAEYEASYRAYLRDRPALVEWLVTTCGNVYDDRIGNVDDTDYLQPHTGANHFQDISVRRVIAELVDDPTWPTVTPTDTAPCPLIDTATGDVHVVPRALGMRGDRLLQIRDPESAGFVLNPAVVPVHDPTLITTTPARTEWYHAEGCGHLSVEAFWQQAKVVEVRYDRFLAGGAWRTDPLGGL
jgi:hypothetical protein